MAVQDYKLNVAQHMRGAEDKAVLQYGDELSTLAASLNMSPAIAQTMTDSHFAAVKREASSSADEKEAFGNQQTADLLRVLGDDTEAKLKQASEALSRASGRKLDLTAIVRTNGAEVALMLFNQAAALARVK